ncbi:serine/threonine-protein kinase/endoribonuclease IRE1b [Tanacetum coccineum]
MHDPRDHNLCYKTVPFRYLRGTTDIDSAISVYLQQSYTAYSDLILQSSKRQDTLSRSNAEAEYRGVPELIEPKRNLDTLIISEPDGVSQAFWQHEMLRGNENAGLDENIMENGLECKIEWKWFGVRVHDKIIGLSPDGRLFLFDCPSSEVCWSITTGKALHVSYESSENNCSYKPFCGDYWRVHKHTNSIQVPPENNFLATALVLFIMTSNFFPPFVLWVPQDFTCHAREFFTEPYKYNDGNIATSKTVTEIHVHPGTGQRLSPLSSDGTIMCITRSDYELTCYKPDEIVLWYQRIATFDISIVSRDGARLHETNEVPARMGQTLIKAGTFGKISCSNRVIGKGGKDTVLVEGEYQQRAVIVRIGKGQNDDAVKKEVSIVSDVCEANHNFVKVYGVESDQDFNYVAIEYCGTSLREFIRSFHNPRSQHLKDYSKLLKLIREIVTTLAWLHCNGKSHGNLNLDSIFVDKNSGPKISVFSLSKEATGMYCFLELKYDMLALGHIIFFCFIGLEYDNENLYNPKPKNHLKPIYDCPDALDLLKKLLDKKPETRTNSLRGFVMDMELTNLYVHLLILVYRATALQTSNHTLFWSPRKNLRFIRAVTERLELKGPKLLTAINAINAAVFVQRWDIYLPTDFLDVMEDGSYSHVMKDGSYRKHVYRNNSIYDLLCIIRHAITHEERIRYQLRLKTNLHREVYEMFETEGFESYFRRKFPNLVNEVYNVMNKHLGDEANFLQYYKKSLL